METTGQKPQNKGALIAPAQKPCSILLGAAFLFFKRWRRSQSRLESEVEIVKNMINVDALINTIRDGFYENETYMKDAKNRKKWYSMSDHERTWRERNATHADRQLSNICDILRADWRRLQTIARLTRKWEEKRNWQLCFPAEAHAEKILAYIAK